MNGPIRYFKVRQTPTTCLYLSVIFPAFFICAIICAVISMLLAGSWLSFVAFPIMPIAGVAVLAYFLTAPCVIEANAEGLDIQVTRSGMGIPLGSKKRPWSELEHFQYFSGRSTTLNLFFPDASINFGYGEITELRDYLREHFPEKEKPSWLNSFLGRRSSKKA